ncbi:hypothetical protein Q1695_003023 [Nippostrongylus brasiliensis]|nr:hypothetical protein Q1695_003023 [Nippostrongylus brasiliensis]
MSSSGSSRKGRKSRKSSHHLLDDSGPAPAHPEDFEIREHTWGNLNTQDDEQRSGLIHGSTQSVWRPVRQDSRESRIIYGSESFQPQASCPLHGHLASAGCSVHSMSSVYTGHPADDMVVVPPLPEEPAVPNEPTRQDSRLKPPGARKSRSRSRSRPALRTGSLGGSSFGGSQQTLHSSASYSTGIRSGQGGYSGGKSLFTCLKEFYDKYPRLATFLAIVVFLYFFIHQLDMTIAHIFECMIRIVYPASHYVAVTNEQFFARLSRMASRGDELMEVG